MHVFGRLSNTSYWDCPHAPLVHQHAHLPIFHGGVTSFPQSSLCQCPIWGTCICCTIITTRFLLDYCSFLLEVIGVSNYSFIPFQVAWGWHWNSFLLMWWLVLTLSYNLQIGKYIKFKKTFQTYYTIIPSLALSLTWLLIHIMRAYNIAWAWRWVHGFLFACSFHLSI
jgi:hypothetical protein